MLGSGPFSLASPSLVHSYLKVVVQVLKCEGSILLAFLLARLPKCNHITLLRMVHTNISDLACVAVSSVTNGTLLLVSQPSDDEADFVPGRNDNRTGIALGDSTLVTCTAGHHGDDLMNYSTPSVVWVRNGQVVNNTDSRITLTSTPMANGQITSSLTISEFGTGNAGVYQCVFTDDSDGGDTEVITSIPYRLDTGMIFNIKVFLLYVSHSEGFSFHVSDVDKYLIGISIGLEL